MRKQFCYTCSKPMHPFRKDVYCSYSCYQKERKLMALGNSIWKVRVVDIDQFLKLKTKADTQCFYQEESH